MLFTVGHSNRSLDEFVEILHANGIQFLADIRGGRATSRTFIHFDTIALSNTLPKRGVKYKRIEALGGRRGKSLNVDPTLNDAWRVAAFKNYADYAYDSPEYDAGLRELINLGTRYRTAFMCSEAVPWRCHRSIVTDYLILVYDEQITHLLGVKQTMQGKPHDFAQRQGKKVIYSSGQEQLF